MIWGQMNTKFRDELSGNRFLIFNLIRLLYQHKRDIRYLVKYDITVKLIVNSMFQTMKKSIYEFYFVTIRQ